MAPPTVPVGVPASLRAGDTVVFDILPISDPALGNFTSSAYTLLAQFVSGELGLAAQVAAQGTGWRCTLSAANTQGLKGDSPSPETVAWTLSASAGGERYTLAQGTLLLYPDPAQQTSGAKTHSQTMLELIEAQLEGRLPADLQSYQIGGHAVALIPIDQLLRLRSRYAAEVQAQRTGSLGTPVAWRLRPAC
ncbi:MAG TPA: hypothetical protein VJN95_08655 [Gemmatimonadales bacterium]|nr:hypothetical protein [Gemmatimonadales bacterium]